MKAEESQLSARVLEAHELLSSAKASREKAATQSDTVAAEFADLLQAYRAVSMVRGAMQEHTHYHASRYRMQFRLCVCMCQILFLFACLRWLMHVCLPTIHNMPVRERVAGTQSVSAGFDPVAGAACCTQGRGSACRCGDQNKPGGSALRDCGLKHTPSTHSRTSQRVRGNSSRGNAIVDAYVALQNLLSLPPVPPCYAKPGRL